MARYAPTTTLEKTHTETVPRHEELIASIERSCCTESSLNSGACVYQQLNCTSSRGSSALKEFHNICHTFVGSRDFVKIAPESQTMYQQPLRPRAPFDWLNQYKAHAQ
ncbi:hypothetical protein BgiBS90_011968 [Biomphalaria glabrata]|nr:hypothetical protein BgiBS90_011968 [Biomphalaria glabrata]